MNAIREISKEKFENERYAGIKIPILPKNIVPIFIELF
jgi:nitrogen regulatory protein PII-like uncharacterized protein